MFFVIYFGLSALFTGFFDLRTSILPEYRNLFCHFLCNKRGNMKTFCALFSYFSRLNFIFLYTISLFDCGFEYFELKFDDF